MAARAAGAAPRGQALRGTRPGPPRHLRSTSTVSFQMLLLPCLLDALRCDFCKATGPQVSFCTVMLYGAAA